MEVGDLLRDAQLEPGVEPRQFSPKLGILNQHGTLPLQGVVSFKGKVWPLSFRWWKSELLGTGGDVLTEVGTSEPRGAMWDGKGITAEEPQGWLLKDESEFAMWESGPGYLSGGAACVDG